MNNKSLMEIFLIIFHLCSYLFWHKLIHSGINFMTRNKFSYLWSWMNFWNYYNINLMVLSNQYLVRFQVKFATFLNHMYKQTPFKGFWTWGYPKRGPNFETQYKWNPFEKLMIPSNWLHLVNYESNKKMVQFSL